MNQLLKEAFQLRKNQKFEKAVELYKPLWSDNPDSFSDWDGWSFGFCLSKLGLHTESLEVCRKLYKKYSDKEFLNSLYAKSIYYTQFKNSKESSVENLRKAATAILKLSPPNQTYSYSAIAVFGLTKVLMTQMNINWSEIENWLLKLEPDLLNDNVFITTDKKGKKIELASAKEEWYSLMIRAKAGLDQPQELLKYLEIARKQNLKWHYSNDIWFKRKEAFACLSIGEREKAEKILRKITAQKKDWFLLFDLSKAVKDENERIQLMCEAALSPGKTEHKINLFYSFFELLKNTDQKIAKTNLELVVAIRKENNWLIPDNLKKDKAECQLTSEEIRNSSTILNELKAFWQSLSNEKQTKFEGIVSNILENGKSAFVKEGKNTYYFNMGKWYGKLKTGDKISFDLTDGFDKKKNRSTKIAINIKPL